MSVLSIKNEQNNCINKFRKYSKIFLSTVFIFVLLLVFMIKLISVSYHNYGSKFFGLCFYPIIAMLFINLFIIEIFITLFYTLLLHYLGREIYYSIRGSFSSFVINFIIPAEILSINNGIIEFREYYDRLVRNK